ncbi:hypothetical protein K435DRAFT_103393 [Dendrothele bispora CBS 962.96]|uniref:Uncharacterized protein n=1 Tax=Dendrothele bispora (strain CBS 962.96) TaxID=1314807 RepID=A0A4S8MSM1_DENBC|nr:hypothetical protein K435DRAFT_103393 [Dendrothele bispora CBS 962.96]
MASTISLEAVVYGSLPLYATYTEVKCDRTAKRESILEQIANARRMPEDSLRNAQIFLVNPPIPLEERVNSKMVVQEQVLSSWSEHLSSVTALEFPRFFSPWPGILERQYTLCFLRPLSECIPSDWDMGVFQTPGHINAFVVGPVPGTKRIGDSGASSSSPSKRPRTDSEVPEEEASITASISESTVIPDGRLESHLYLLCSNHWYR